MWAFGASRKDYSVITNRLNSPLSERLAVSLNRESWPVQSSYWTPVFGCGWCCPSSSSRSLLGSSVTMSPNCSTATRRSTWSRFLTGERRFDPTSSLQGRFNSFIRMFVWQLVKRKRTSTALEICFYHFQQRSNRDDFTTDLQSSAANIIVLICDLGRYCSTFFSGWWVLVCYEQRETSLCLFKKYLVLLIVPVVHQAETVKPRLLRSQIYPTSKSLVCVQSGSAAQPHPQREWKIHSSTGKLSSSMIQWDQTTPAVCLPLVSVQCCVFCFSRSPWGNTTSTTLRPASSRRSRGRLCPRTPWRVRLRARVLSRPGVFSYQTCSYCSNYMSGTFFRSGELKN